MTGAATVASDVFSVGVTLLELWVGSIGETFDHYEGIPTGQVGAESLRAMRREMVFSKPSLQFLLNSTNLLSALCA